jgi:hypothetical protein
VRVEVPAHGRRLAGIRSAPDDFEDGCGITRISGLATEITAMV